MNTEQLIGTSFEYANISIRAGRITNELQDLISYLVMYKIPSEEHEILAKARQLLIKYHFSYTQSSLEKQIKDNSL